MSPCAVMAAAAGVVVWPAPPGCHRRIALVEGGILPTDWLKHWQAIAATILAQYRDLSRAYARHRLPLFADAFNRLCV